MTVRALIELTGAHLLTGGVDLDREISMGYCCDMLSWVMAHAQADMAWITVQSHMNVVAVATMMEMSAVIIPEGIQVDEEVASKAQDEGLALLTTDKTAFELCGALLTAGVPARKG